MISKCTLLFLSEICFQVELNSNIIYPCFIVESSDVTAYLVAQNLKVDEKELLFCLLGLEVFGFGWLVFLSTE